MITIALDAMGGDFGPSVIVPAALAQLKKYPDLSLILVGIQDQIVAELARHNVSETERLLVKPASEIVEMDEPPAQALRYKKDSSMRVAINLVKENKAHACVSAGNTGALMATAKFVLKTLHGIDRPAICALLPTLKENGFVRVLDLGANVDSTAEQLFQFAVMGSVLSAAVDHIHEPKIALLNIGEEAIKGNEQVKETANLLQNADGINYIGYIEGDQIYTGIADVVVCDGFVGNVALKTSEGLAKFIMENVRKTFKSSLWGNIVGMFAKPILKSLAKKLDPSRYNGATLLGLQGTVIKSHGSANQLAFENAIEQAVLEALNQVPERISTHVSAILAGE